MCEATVSRAQTRNTIERIVTILPYKAAILFEDASKRMSPITRGLFGSDGKMSHVIRNRCVH